MHYKQDEEYDDDDDDDGGGGGGGDGGGYVSVGVFRMVVIIVRMR